MNLFQHETFPCNPEIFDSHVDDKIQETEAFILAIKLFVSIRLAIDKILNRGDQTFIKK